MVERLCCINIDLNRIIIDQTFEHIYPGRLKEDARASVAFEAFYGVEQISADQRRIAAQACAHRYNCEWNTRRFLERLDQAIDEAHRNARHIGKQDEGSCR